ncbi:hypothetical protein D3C75_911080 [compost metagenome]
MCQADGKADGLLITLSRDTADIESLWHRPVPLLNELGVIPKNFRGNTPFAWILPIGFPAGLELQAQQNAGFGWIAGICLQPNLRVIVSGAGKPAGIAGQSH